MSKEIRFNRILKSCKKALDSIGVEFHLHFGTALGAHREKTFIKHDDDIDVAVFSKDINNYTRVNEIIYSMENNGFKLLNSFGTIKSFFELQFEKDNIGLDIFWITKKKYKGKNYFMYSSYYGLCDKLKNNKCIWGMSPYKTIKINFLGIEYNIIPKSTLVDLYGKDWKIPKKYYYFEGLQDNNFKGLLPDYFNPISKKDNKKIAFCFLLYDTHKHNDVWKNFFNQETYQDKRYNIYSHLKTINEKTPKWLSDNKIKSIKTGWCEENLVLAWIKLLQQALKDPKNKYFTILSGDCIPLYDFEDTYKRITSTKKSRINIDYNAESYVKANLLYADQWVILNRDHAKLLVKLKTTEEGKNFTRELRKKICKDGNCYCPDEIYPISWFIKKYGKPSSQTFKKNFINKVSTYTYWDGKKSSPLKFNSISLKKKKKRICKSNAIFARKFNSKAGKIIGMNC